MSNYSQVTFFAPKDLLSSGNPNKVIYGAQVDPELSAIAVAIATKYDSSSIGTGQIPFGDGSVGAPSITFASALTTGLYKAAANSLGFATNGLAVGSIASTGNWLVGSSSISQNLPILQVTANSTSGQSLGLKVLGGTTTADFSARFQNQAGTQDYLLLQGDGQSFVFQPPAATDKSASSLFQAGWMDIPQNNQTASYTAAITDRGKAIYLTGSTAAQTVTIPHAVFPKFAVFMIINNTTQPWSIAADGTSTLRVGALTGTRTLASTGIMTVYSLDGTNFWAWGTQIS